MGMNDYLKKILLSRVYDVASETPLDKAEERGGQPTFTEIPDTSREDKASMVQDKAVVCKPQRPWDVMERGEHHVPFPLEPFHGPLHEAPSSWIQIRLCFIKAVERGLAREHEGKEDKFPLTTREADEPPPCQT